MAKIVARVRTEGGRLLYDNLPAFIAAVRERSDGPGLLTLADPARKGSDPQRRWWFGVAVKLVADTAGYDRDERREVHDDLMCEFFGYTERPSALPGNPPRRVPNVTYSKTTLEQRRELMEWVVRWAARKLNCIIPLPDDPICESIIAEDEAA